MNLSTQSQDTEKAGVVYILELIDREGPVEKYTLREASENILDEFQENKFIEKIISFDGREKYKVIYIQPPHRSKNNPTLLYKLVCLKSSSHREIENPPSSSPCNESYFDYSEKNSSLIYDDLVSIIPPLILNRDIRIDSTQASYECRFKDQTPGNISSSLVFDVKRKKEQIHLKQIQFKKSGTSSCTMVRRAHRKRESSSDALPGCENPQPVELNEEIFNDLNSLVNPSTFPSGTVTEPGVYSEVQVNESSRIPHNAEPKVKSLAELQMNQNPKRPEQIKTSKSHASINKTSNTDPSIIFNLGEAGIRSTSDLNKNINKTQNLNKYNTIEGDSLNIKNIIHKNSPINLHELQYSNNTFAAQSDKLDRHTLGFSKFNQLENYDKEDSGVRSVFEPLFKLAENKDGFLGVDSKNLVQMDSLSENSFKCSTTSYFNLSELAEREKSALWQKDDLLPTESELSNQLKNIETTTKSGRRGKSIKMRISPSDKNEVCVIKIVLPNKKTKNEEAINEPSVAIPSPPSIKVPENTPCNGSVKDAPVNESKVSQRGSVVQEECIKNSESVKGIDKDEDATKKSVKDSTAPPSSKTPKSEIKNEEDKKQPTDDAPKDDENSPERATGEVLIESIGSVKEKIEFFESLSNKNKNTE